MRTFEAERWRIKCPMMTDPTEKTVDIPVEAQDENTGVAPPDTTATAAALGGMANLPTIDYDQTTQLDDVQKPTQA